MDQRVQFIAAHLSGQYTVTELCEEYGMAVYPGHCEPALEYRSGLVTFRGRMPHVGEAFRGQTVACEAVDDSRWRVYYRDWLLGIYDETTNRIERYGPRNRPKQIEPLDDVTPALDPGR